MNLEGAESEPWRFDFFAAMRALERANPTLPRIGDAGALREEYARLGQDPYMDFPASTLSKFETRETHTRILTKFLGFLGPQGALPLATTEEAYNWFLAQDDSFPRFLDIINHRFLQLFFRAWADSRPVAQHDRPNDDRFETYVGASAGLGSPIYRDLDSVDDRAKLCFAGVLGPQAKSASRLRAFICGHFHVEAEIEEFVGSRLELEPADQSKLGSASLGVDMLLGASFYSVQDKVRIRIYVPDMKAYRRFLPDGDFCEPLADIVFFYVGEELDWDLELAIPAKAAEPVKLGRSGDLGWTSWVAPDWAAADAWRRDARFHPAERMREARARAARTKHQQGRGKTGAENG
ncbi:type VI secretion protein, VC_A0111 family [Methylocella silvestris BL2]|uniref:Type VI secretion protein, VC_A0111 family n=1 Tax=Methylocella silvestris (strain DSM 15510 / CIP 108128 / LMG 27833 / NCIMB 13906 / BL2) TaxID=395965 RepID=B8EIH6_METSB|nr:type VI secretion system baseplate subunit TssG [Methylocella silvestris]ACK51295.1 type VI secretion protein, VC_A0111 family [Methylocella silvestris BL2]